MPKKGETAYTAWNLHGDAPAHMRSLKRVPVIVRPVGLGTSVLRVSSNLSLATDVLGDAEAQLWTTDEKGGILERLTLRCGGCGHKATLYELKLWRKIHKNKSWVPPFYCCRQCKAKKGRKPSKKKGVVSMTPAWPYRRPVGDI